jgi:hypothetical protein
MIHWKLPNMLKAHDITAYRLNVACGGTPNRNAIYAMAKGEVQRVDIDSLSALITALRTLTGKPLTVSDLLEYQEPATTAPEPAATPARDQSDRQGTAGTESENGAPAPTERLTAAGVPYTGDEETDAILNEHPDILERIARIERGEEEFYTIDEMRERHNIPRKPRLKTVNQ